MTKVARRDGTVCSIRNIKSITEKKWSYNALTFAQNILLGPTPFLDIVRLDAFCLCFVSCIRSTAPYVYNT